MTASRGLVASTVLSCLVVCGMPVVAGAQHATSPSDPSERKTALVPGSIHGQVRDETGAPVAGAMVSALGATSAFAFSDRRGRFALEPLVPGPYVVRAYLKGFHAPRPAVVDVQPSGRSASAIALRKNDNPPVLTAGFGGAAAVEEFEEQIPEPLGSGSDRGDQADSETGHIEEHETLWRLRHARRGVLKSATMFDHWLDGGDLGAADMFGPADAFGRAVATPARLATNFFVETPFSGQINLLTTSSFERPEDLLSFARLGYRTAGVAHVSVGAPVGDSADWTVSGAMSQDDLSSWIVAGSYVTRTPANHRYDVGVSYSAQRYWGGGNPLGLRGVADVTRNAGAVHGFDTFAVTPALRLTYGGRYARYDYLGERGLVSPSVEMLIIPVDGLRFGMSLSRSAHAPGAEEFLPPGDTGIWLPPQRTFSSISADRSLEAERVNQIAVEVERDIAGSTVALRAFRQKVDGQLLTLFGEESPDQPVARLGHYFVGNAGNVDATGAMAEFRGKWAGRVEGSVSYRLTRAHFDPTTAHRYVLLLSQGAQQSEVVERIHDVATSIQADVPETATRVLLIYRTSNAFAGVARRGEAHEGRRSGLDYRFDVQVRQGLPFIDFSNAKWEMLVAVRNFFREAGDDQSVYGELLVVRPPKRIVGGVALHF